MKHSLLNIRVRRAGLLLATSRIFLASLVWLALHSADPKTAWAQPAAKADTPSRSGVTGGIGMGIGSLEIGNESHGTINYTLHFGGYITNQWALQLEFWGGLHNDDEFRIRNSNRGLSAQYWMRDRKIWWKAMLGASTLKTTFDGLTFGDFSGVAIGGAGGWVFYERADYHVDAQFRLSVEGFEDARDNAVAIVLGVGVSYF